MSSPDRMRAGLLATRDATATTVGTITLDSYTRVGDLESAGLAVLEGVALNGYPIVSHPTATTRAVLDGIHGPDFPVQVRHGSAAPQDIFRALTAVGLDASEGGPVSYCLPYGRVPLRASVAHWAASCALLAARRESGAEPHLETFGGCVLGQLCPPGLLVAISVLEALFFRRHGIRSISVSYAQQTDPLQDAEAVAALRSLCVRWLPDTEWHVVVYAYMGLFPETEEGAYRLLGKAAELAVATGSERLIVKTVAESRRIPTVTENVAALEHAAAVAARTPRTPWTAPPPRPTPRRRRWWTRCWSWTTTSAPPCSRRSPRDISTSPTACIRTTPDAAGVISTRTAGCAGRTSEDAAERHRRRPPRAGHHLRGPARLPVVRAPFVRPAHPQEVPGGELARP